MSTTTGAVQEPDQSDRTTMDIEGLKRACFDNLFYLLQGRFSAVAAELPAI